MHDVDIAPKVYQDLQDYQKKAEDQRPAYSEGWNFFSYDATARESYAAVPVEFVAEWWGLDAVVQGIKNAFEDYLCQQRERAGNAQRRINGCNRALEALRAKEGSQCYEEPPPPSEKEKSMPKRFSWGWWAKLLG